MHLLFMAALLVIGPVDKAAPNRMPQMAASKSLTAVVFASQSSIWFAASKDGAQTFSTPVKVTGVPAMAVGRHRGPHIVISGKTIVVSAITGSTVSQNPHAHGNPENGDLVAWRSEDEGRTWSKPVVIDDVPAAAREGLHAMAVNAQGDLAAAWLDLRGKGTRLYGAYSKDAGKTWSKNVLLFEAPEGTICQCCAPSLAGTDGGFEVMFRNVVAGNRDMYLLQWPLGDKVVGAPVKMGNGSWQLNACPMDGGGVAAVNGKTVSAWRREETVFLDESGKPEKAVGTGKDVALAVTKRGAYVAWTGAKGIEVHVPGQAEDVELGAGAFGNLVALPDGEVVAAWEQDGGIRIAVVEEGQKNRLLTRAAQ
jgi:hypothetical protein